MHISLPLLHHLPPRIFHGRTYLLLGIATLPALHVLEILLLRLDVKFDGLGDGDHRDAVFLALLQPLGGCRLGPVDAVDLDAAAAQLAIFSTIDRSVVERLSRGLGLVLLGRGCNVQIPVPGSRLAIWRSGRGEG